MKIEEIFDLCEDIPDKEYQYYIKTFEAQKEKVIKDLKSYCKINNINSHSIFGYFKLKVKKVHSNNNKYYYTDVFYFTAWNEQHVFVQGIYDGASCIVAIPRNPSKDIIETIGGE